MVLGLSWCGGVQLPGLEALSNEADVAAMKVRAFDDLKAGDADAKRLMPAALEFTELLDYYTKKSDMDQVCDMQADIYWCKKRMNAGDLASYLASKGEFEKGLADRAEQVVASQPMDQAEAYLARADAYAKANPGDALALAIRYFEVADRFAGSSVSLHAQRLSLDYQRKAMASDAGPGEPAGRPGAETVAGDLPPSAAELVTASNLAVRKLFAKAGEDLKPLRQRTLDTLLKEADAEQRKGSLDTLLATQRQLNHLEQTQDGLPASAQATTMKDYAKAKHRIIAKVQDQVVGEKRKLLSAPSRRTRADQVLPRKGNGTGRRRGQGPAHRDQRRPGCQPCLRPRWAGRAVHPGVGGVRRQRALGGSAAPGSGSS